MKLTAEIKVLGDGEKLYLCFEPEQNNQKRSNFKLIKKEDGVVFEIKAEDSTALRATMNGITKLITVYEKVNNHE